MTRAHVHAAGAVFGREVGALDLHLLNHVVVQRHHHAAVAADVEEVRSIELRGVARRSDAVDGIVLDVLGSSGRLADIGVRRPRREGCASSSSALRPMIDRLSICFCREDAFAGARLRLDHIGLRRDRDRLGLLADIEPHVDTTRIVRADGDRLLLVGLEPGELDLQVVGAGEQAREGGNCPRSSLTVVCTPRYRCWSS